MLRPYAIAAIATLFCLSLIAILVVSYPREADGRRYALLMQQTKAQKEEASTHRQVRQGVRKDLVMSRPGGRYRALLTSPTSELTLTKDATSSEVVEEIKKFTCAMQEEFYTMTDEGKKRGKSTEGTPMQVIREFTAADGEFFYARQLMQANNVFVTRYQVEGEEFPIVPQATTEIMKGVSKNSELYFGNGFRFRANQMKATFFGEEFKR